MIQLIKNVIKGYLAKKGLEISTINEYQKKIDKVNDVWLKDLKYNTIIDVGANDGGFARKIKKVFPNAKLYCFEALDDIYEELNAKTSSLDNIQTENIALSNEIGEVTFYRCVNNTGSSSMLEMGDIHKVAYPETAENIEVKVKTTTLDTYFESNPLVGPTMLKIDVQGAEMLVLKGGLKTLEKVDMIFCEVNFLQTYKGCVLFGELYDFLNQRGFGLIGMENVSQSAVDGRYLQADAYFMKK
jgi:FkbM family methyltransferase